MVRSSVEWSDPLSRRLAWRQLERWYGEDTPTPSKAKPASEARVAPRAGERRVTISNPKKVFWPAEGFTKSDLCGYYEAMAPVLLPWPI